MNKGFYMATLAVLAASMSKKATSKQKRTGSLSIEDLNALSSATKRRARWGTEDPLANIRDISIDISTEKPHFTPYQVENAIKTIQRLTGLNRAKIVIRKHFPIRILDGLITNHPDVANWYIPIRYMKELDVTVYTEQDMRDDFFIESPRSLSKIELTLNSNRIPTSLFGLEYLKELKFRFYEKNYNNIVFPQLYNLKSLEKLEITAGSDWRKTYTENKFRLPDYISSSKNLRELTLNKIATSPEIKRLRNLEKVNITDILIETHMLEIRTISLRIFNGTLSGKIKPRVNNRIEFLDIDIISREGVVDLSFLSKMKKVKEIKLHIDWRGQDEVRKIIMPKNIKALSNLEKLVIKSSYYGVEKPILTLPRDFQTLSKLKYLSLWNVKFDFNSNVGFPSLEKINLYSCIISNINMSGFSSLKEINIEGPWRYQNVELTTITDDSFSGLSNLRKLKIKNIYATQIPNISGLTNLTSVIIEGKFVKTNIPVLEKDITSLKKLKRLTLGIERPNNTDPLISLPKFVTMLPNLEYLNLKSSEISDLTGIENLKKIKGIKSSIPTLKRIRKRPNNYKIVEMTKNGLSQSDAIKIMKYSSSTPISQIRRF